MNHLQFGLFLFYFFSLFCYGSRIYAFLNPANGHFLNRFVYVGETLLLGGIFVVGAMVFVSLIGLYSAPFLWGIVLLGYAAIFSKTVRCQWQAIFSKKIRWSIPLIVFFLLVAVYIFRNCFFLVDVDSHAIYLFTQKLWLANKTSLVGDVATVIGVFAPQFNSVPYALGLSLLGQELLFPQLIVVSWGVITLLLIFGYISFRFNGYYALAGAMFVLFDHHFFYSGENSCCIINNALGALLFASAYNFWETRKEGEGSVRLLLALIFLIQLMANKYQVLLIAIFIFLMGLFIQEKPWQKLVGLLRSRVYLTGLVLSLALMLLWYVKNFLITGVPAFPILADRFGVFNWTPQMAQAFNRIFVGPVIPSLFMKYMSYLFVWPGVDALKVVIVAILSSPIIFLFVHRRAIPKEQIEEWHYWLALSILVVLGLCLVSFVDPRHYRYGIAIFTFAAVVSLRLIVRSFFPLIPGGLMTALIILFPLHNASIVFVQGGSTKFPTFEDNLKVISNRLHFKDVTERYYPQNLIVALEYGNYPDRISKSAWDTGVGGVTPLSAFLLPIRPQLGLWQSTVVRWDSYGKAQDIVKDLKDYGIEWVMRVEDNKLRFISAQDYALEAVGYNRYPKNRFYDYGFPKELSEVKTE